MAESYTVPGQVCSVGEYAKLIEQGKVAEAWRGYCDCMFLEPVETTEFLCDGSPVPPHIFGVLGLYPKDEQKALVAKSYCDTKGGKYAVRIKVVPRRTENWEKCMGMFCSLPWGCPHPHFPDELHIPFNIAPHIVLAPWTDLGAAARGVPKKNAGIFYTVGQVFTLDLKQYEPLSLWRNKMTNPALYELNKWKLNLVPGIGSVLVQALSAPFPLDLAGLLPLALTQAAIEGKSTVDYIFKPALIGGITNAVFALKVIGPAMGQQYFAVAGMVLQKFAKDQIDTGEIDKVLDPVSNGAIRFFAEAGEEIGLKLQNALGEGFDLKSAPGILQVMSHGFGAIAESPHLTDPLARAIIQTTSDVLAIAAIIAEGFRKYAKLPLADKMWAIADDVVFRLFGFSLDELKRTVQKGAAEVQVLFDTAKRKGKSGNAQGLMDALDAVGKAFDRIVQVLNDINKALDGSLDKFNEQFTGFKQVLDVVKTDTTAAFNAVASGTEGSVVITATTALESTVPAANKITVSPVRIPAERFNTIVKVPEDAIMTSSPPLQRDSSSPGSTDSDAGGGLGVALAGAGAGFLVGGPVGAAAGAIAGFMLGQRSAPALPPSQQVVTGTPVSRPVLSTQPAGTPTTGTTQPSAPPVDPNVIPLTPPKVTTSRIASVLAMNGYHVRGYGNTDLMAMQTRLIAPSPTYAQQTQLAPATFDPNVALTASIIPRDVPTNVVLEPPPPPPQTTEVVFTRDVVGMPADVPPPAGSPVPGAGSSTPPPTDLYVKPNDVFHKGTGTAFQPAGAMVAPPPQYTPEEAWRLFQPDRSNEPTAVTDGTWQQGTPRDGDGGFLKRNWWWMLIAAGIAYKKFSR